MHGEVQEEGERLKDEMNGLGDAVRANVAGRVNIAKAVNIGSKGARRMSSSRQTVRIKQDGETTIEDSESIETNVESED